MVPEDPITEKQVQFILHLNPALDEREVRLLGKWHASNLIEQLLAVERKTGFGAEATDHPTQSNNFAGVFQSLILLVILGAIGTGLYLTLTDQGKALLLSLGVKLD